MYLFLIYLSTILFVLTTTCIFKTFFFIVKSENNFVSYIDLIINIFLTFFAKIFIK